jgi:hypothetical protein
MSQMGELSDFEVVEPVGPLMLFGEGMVLRVRVWGAELTVLFPCDVARFAVSARPGQPPEDDAPLRARFAPGVRLRGSLSLRAATPDAVTPEVVPATTPLGLTVTAPDVLHAAHGVALVGEVRRVDAEEVWVDCGLPVRVLAPWTCSPAPVLPCRARWLGDLWLLM